MKVFTKRPNGSLKVSTVYEMPSKTDTSYAKDCDVNEIIRRFKKTGHISHLAKGQASYSDVSEIPDLVTAMDQVSKAQQAFDALPADIRLRFGNSPVNMVNFIADESNRSEAEKLGLLKKLEPVPQAQVNQAISAVGTQNSTQQITQSTSNQTTTN